MTSEAVDEKNLLSIQFCEKVYAGLKDGTLNFKQGDFYENKSNK